ncbi:MAG: ketoacyl-ACP synthase III [Acidobacteriota bacterium]|nr:ketoacyl-ACP synthase III [Acidobacteriota bacterium]
MSEKRHSVIIGSGSYIPERRAPNASFLKAEFYDGDGKRLAKANEETIRKLEEITGIAERRYVTDDLMASDIAALAAQNALDSSGVDRESLDYVIVAHDFGDVRASNPRSEFVPTLAARVKHRLGIVNPGTVAYDIAFGCPGWLQAVIQADYYLRSGDCRRALVIGTETLSRVSDPHDRDSMIYADGAGATILEAVESNEPIGILSHAMRSDTLDYAYLLSMQKSYHPEPGDERLYLKMDGHKLYEYALKTVPLVLLECLKKAGLGIRDIRKVLIHQANEKMDEAILKRAFKLAGIAEPPADIMPMTIGWLGNSSVATLPTLYDLMAKGKLDGHPLPHGSAVLFASVGAGMNSNAVAYRLP